MSTEKLFGQRLQELREERKISRAKLCEAMMVTPQAVGKWERGESLPDVLSLKKLADILGVKMEAFFLSAEDYKNLDGVKENEQADSKLISPRAAWNLSLSSWVDADFSKLKDVADRLSCSNIISCNLSDSVLSKVVFRANNIKNCNFSAADLSKSRLAFCKIQKNNFAKVLLFDSEFSHCAIIENDFSGADFTNAKIEYGTMSGCDFSNAKLGRMELKYTLLENMVVENDIENCSFVSCQFKNIVFRNMKFTNTFFKNHKHKKCVFENCTADNISYAFLASNKVDIAGLVLA